MASLSGCNGPFSTIDIPFQMLQIRRSDDGAVGSGSENGESQSRLHPIRIEVESHLLPTNLILFAIMADRVFLENAEEH